MHIHARIHDWVLGWFYVGILCGIVALVNIFVRDPSAAEVKVILAVGVFFWLLGGLLCYAFEGVKIRSQPKAPEKMANPQIPQQREWHSASDFVLPGNRKSLLPPKY